MSERGILYVWPDGKMVLQAADTVRGEDVQDLQKRMEVARESFRRGKPIIVGGDIEVRPALDEEIAARMTALEGRVEELEHRDCGHDD